MSDTRHAGLLKACMDLGVPADDAFALAPLVEEWFDAASEAPGNGECGFSVASYAELPDLVRRLSKWSRLDD